MTERLIGVYGMSGFGREVMPLVRESCRSIENGPKIVFIDDEKSVGTVNGHEVMTYKEFLAFNSETKEVAIAIANSKVREQLSLKLLNDGIKPFTVKASNIIALGDVDIDEGAILCPFVTLTSNVKIGRHFHANIYSYVAHDCSIGDYVTLAPRVCCNGNVHIEDHAYIGTAAVIKQGTPEKPIVIGRGAIVGMGAVVTKSVDPDEVVVGNPAKPFKK